MKIAGWIFVLWIIPILGFGQTDTQNGKFTYVVCDQQKSQFEKGSILKNVREIQIDTTVNAVFGKIVDFKNEPIPFAIVNLQFADGTVYTTKTDLSGKYKFSNLQGGFYSLSVLMFGYEAFQVESVSLTTGDERQIDIDLGENKCLKTKTITTDTPLSPGEYQPQ